MAALLGAAGAAVEDFWALASRAEPGAAELLAAALRRGGDEAAAACTTDEASGESLLMRAAANGNVAAVEVLLGAGAPWNAIDRQGLCAGQYALRAGHQEVVDSLVTAGVRAELVLGLLESRVLERGPATNAEYLSQDVQYTDDATKLMEPQGEAVMMEWERPLMRLHAQLLCGGGAHVLADAASAERAMEVGDEAGSSSSSSGGGCGGGGGCGCDGGEVASPSGAAGRHILNVGFGMGIFDGYVQELGAGRHTIIEAHPTVYKRMLADGWDKRPGVSVRFGRWQDVVPSLAADDFDGIFFDTFGEHYADMKVFHAHLPRLLRAGGVYSFFNGLCPRNIFFHGVACQVVQLELAQLGFACEFLPVEVGEAANESSTWQGVRQRYWWSDQYYLPVATLTEQRDDDDDGDDVAA
jgi:protein arginine N-methyltransferase 2